MKTFVVITTINPYNAVMRGINDGCKKKEWSFVVAGDANSVEIKAEGLDFMDIKAQLDTGFSYAKLAPVKNYCRKNVAYLKAIRDGAERIIETDDDNFPYDKFFRPFEDKIKAKVTENEGFINVYRYFTDKTDKIWPRGFSLEDIRNNIIPYHDLKESDIYCPVQNGMVDKDPDVDAVFRLLFDLPFEFEHKNRILALKNGSWCSFNTQNTTFYKDFFPLMYQPATPMFREADILRSFVIQRILWENNANLLFYSPTVYQDRNPHNYISDLRQEVRLYGYVREVCDKLESLDIKSGKENFYDNMIKCYNIYRDYNFVNDLEFQLIDCWFNDLKKSKYDY